MNIYGCIGYPWDGSIVSSMRLDLQSFLSLWRWTVGRLSLRADGEYHGGIDSAYRF